MSTLKNLLIFEIVCWEDKSAGEESCRTSRSSVEKQVHLIIKYIIYSKIIREESVTSVVQGVDVML